MKTDARVRYTKMRIREAFFQCLRENPSAGSRPKSSATRRRSTGLPSFANGAVKNAPLALHRQSVCASPVSLDGGEREIELTPDGLIPPE